MPNQYMSLNNHFLPKNNMQLDLFALLDHNTLNISRPSKTSRAATAAISQSAM